MSFDMLKGKRLLLVEDEFMIAAMVEDMLAEFGVKIVGPAPSLSDGLRLAATETIDAAILDINLNGDRVDTLVEVLSARGIPIVFATGYGKEAPAITGNAIVLDKPYNQQSLADALVRLLIE